MGETDVAALSSTPITAKKSKSPKKPRKPKATPSHPKVAEMVTSAIEDLQAEKGGMSLQAIKKYIASNYKVDMTRQAIFVRRYLKSAVASGSLVQTKGSGASGTFKKTAPKSSSKTARQQAIADKPKKTPSSAKKASKKSKALAKKPVVKKLKAKTPVKKAISKSKKAKSSKKAKK